MDIEKIINGAANEIEINTDIKPKKSAAGRRNDGLTMIHKENDADIQRDKYNMIKKGLSGDTFTIERVAGEVVQPDDLNNYRELYTLTCNDCLARFKDDNPDLVKKHPYNWYKPVLVDIKRNTPAAGADDLEKLSIIWDCLSDFLLSIGLCPSFEMFSYMTGVYKYQLEKRAALNSKYKDFTEKIKADSENALLNDLLHNPYAQTNKIFLAKVHGIIEKTEPKQIEVHHDIRKFDNLPMFGASDHDEN